MACVVNGYTVIPVVRSTGAAQRFLYCKKHSSKAEDSSESHPAGRALFVANLPLDADQQGLASLFTEFGTVDRVDVSTLSKGRHAQGARGTSTRHALQFEEGSRIAYVVFSTPRGVSNVLKANADRKRVIEQAAQPRGLHKWIDEHKSSIIDIATAQAEVDEYMQKHDEAERQAREAEAARENVPDSDGWVTVSRRRSATPTAAARALQEEGESPAAALQRRKKALSDFYRFQQRDARRTQLDRLREKFEEDKQKIASMRAARKFRPV
ncbi:hypothetical protein CAOG_08189 [Capsaspora owczarzaki ATCC 30864]|nr:hypothetical protein CAOG_08189 [Capsaspora owczarzaki ATCC 30864]|eukprot:XP_004342790.1 hypothetical protein CAOG_08189 [Capsaspora owczarzaki ATCC 30864]